MNLPIKPADLNFLHAVSMLYLFSVTLFLFYKVENFFFPILRDIESMRVSEEDGRVLSSNPTQDSKSTRNATSLLKKSSFHDRQGKQTRPAR